MAYIVACISAQIEGKICPLPKEKQVLPFMLGCVTLHVVDVCFSHEPFPSGSVNGYSHCACHFWPRGIT